MNERHVDVDVDVDVPFEQGWDVFSLEYTVTPPLTTVFTESAMGKYLRVFNFLWRLKRVEHSLCATWQTMKPNVTAALQRDGVSGSAGRALADELRRCHTLRGEMHHFIANLQYYVMFEAGTCRRDRWSSTLIRRRVFAPLLVLKSLKNS